MKKYYLAAIIVTFALAGASISALAQDKGTAIENSKASFILISPRDGDILLAGQQVQVIWDLTLDKTFSENPFAEMEFFLDTNEGVHTRITPQLSVYSRTFTFTVPKMNTQTARLSLKCGIEGGGDPYYFAQTGTFSIKSGRKTEAIMLNPMRNNVKPGDELEISWTSNLAGDASYDVMVSYDRGAHFHKAGSTTENHYSLPVDEDFAGSITVQIVNRHADGSKVTSLLTRSATVRVSDKQDF